MSPLELAHKPSPRQALTIQLPLKEGVSPSCVALSNGSWGLVLEFLVQRLPAVSHAVWLQRMAEGWVLDATGMAIKPSATCDDLPEPSMPSSTMKRAVERGAVASLMLFPLCHPQQGG